MTIEVDTDKLSRKGWAAVRRLLDECEVGEPSLCEAKVDERSVLASAAARLVGILRAEPKGNQLRIVQAYIAKGGTRLTAEELAAAAQKTGPALAGVLSSLTRNWRKAGMTGRKAIVWDIMPDGTGAYTLASGDDAVFKAVAAAVRAA